VQTVLDCITESLQRGEKIELRGFGSFRIRNRRRAWENRDRLGVSVPAKGAVFQTRQRDQDLITLMIALTPWRFDTSAGSATLRAAAYSAGSWRSKRSRELVSSSGRRSSSSISSLHFRPHAHWPTVTSLPP